MGNSRRRMTVNPKNRTERPRDLSSSSCSMSSFRVTESPPLQRIDEDDVRRGPERGWNGVLRAAGEDDLENFALAGEFVEKDPARGRRVRLNSRELDQRVINDFVRRRRWRDEAVRAKLNHGVDFVEMPRNRS